MLKISVLTRLFRWQVQIRVRCIGVHMTLLYSRPYMTPTPPRDVVNVYTHIPFILITVSTSVHNIHTAHVCNL